MTITSKSNIQGATIGRNLAAVCFVLCFVILFVSISIKVNQIYEFSKFWIVFGISLGGLIISLITLIMSISYICTHKIKEEE